MRKSTKTNKVDAFVENAGFAMEAAKEAVKEVANDASEIVDNLSEHIADAIDEVATSETYANIKENAVEITDKTAKLGKSAFKAAKAFIKSKID